ncbi:MAG: tetratricopeptide repeat protein [Cyanobacteria bacterium P01_F01_bin.150]
MLDNQLRQILALRKTDRKAAIAQVQSLLNIYPDFTSGWLELGKLLRSIGDRTQSKICFQKAYDLDSENVAATVHLVQELIFTKAFNKAESYLQAAMEIHPRSVDLLIQWGQLERHRGKRAEAIRWFRKIEHVTETLTQRREAHLYIVEELRELGQLDDALALITQVLEQWPEHLRSRMVYGTVLHHRGEWQAAVDTYQLILNKQPSYAPALNWLLKAIPHLGDAQQDILRIEQFQDWLESDRHTLRQSNPQDYRKYQIHVCLWLGDRYRKQQRRQQAYQLYLRAVELSPNHLWANLNVAIELRDMGRFEEAEAVLSSALERHPNHFNVLMQLGQLERSQHNADKAIAYLEQAQQVRLNHLEPTLKIVEVLREAGKLDEAGDRLQNLLNQQTHYTANEVAKIDIQWGWIERQKGNGRAALQWFYSARSKLLAPLDDQPKDSSNIPSATLNLLSQCQWLVIEELRGLGEFDSAKDELEHSSPQIKAQVRTQLLLGSILQQTLELDRAKTSYRTVLETHPDHLGARIELARILGQTGHPQDAIAMLEDTYQTLGPQLRVLLLLGQLHKALDDWDCAQHWFETAYNHCGESPLAHCAFADTLFHQGDIERALDVLTKGQAAFPRSVDISLKFAVIAQQSGKIKLAKASLTQAAIFAQNIPLQVQYCRLLIRCGELNDAIATLNQLNTDQHNWCKQIEQLRGEIAVQQYDFNTAEEHYQKAITLHPPTPHERNQLARILLLQGQIDKARHQLQLATEELEKKRPPGQIGLPIKNHVATVINEFRMNPPMMAQLEDTQEEEGRDRLLSLGSLLVQEPTFLGSAIYLVKELRVQGIFKQLQQALPNIATGAMPIPKQIVQFWDDLQPPEDVYSLGQTWVEQNPEYEYKRFSLGEAIAFLQAHYDDDVLQAFRLCSHVATQADFFRLAYLNKMGGFYADADDRCLNSLEELRASNAELVLFQEDFACLGNNFLGCVPGQPMIRAALYQAVDNLLNYSAEWAWSQTGPGLLTSVVCSGLGPYLASSDYRMWPRLWVMTRGELTSFVWIHVQLAYKGTEKSWQSHAYPKTQLASGPVRPSIGSDNPQ